jgi:choice-of-anchor B domain-containing protein
MNKFILSLALAFSFCLAKAQINSAKTQTTYPSSNINLVGFIDPETVAGVDAIKYSGCWGYQQTSKNKEYAIVGSSTGTYFIDITAPATPTVCDYVKGAHSSPCIWREMHTYQNYCYVVSDDGPPNSFQIIDMKYLPDSVHVVYDGKNTYFERAHQINVDGNKLYVSGITFSGSGNANMRVYSLATPTAPVLLRTLSQDDPSVSYVHDMTVRNDTVFAHCGNAGMRVYKFTSGNTFSLLGSLSGYTDAGYNHSSAWTQDGKTLIFCDEVPSGLRMKSADVTNLSNITISSLFRPNTYSGFTGHNPYILGNKYVFISCYEDGLNLYDISNPFSPSLLGYFDTYPQGGANLGGNYGSDPENGNWGAYPYFKSGYILACDMQNGVFILEAFGILGNPTVVSPTKRSDDLIFNVFPNPATNNLSISIKDNGSEFYAIEMQNMQGQVVLSETEKNSGGNQFISKKLNISDLSAGIYMVSVSTPKSKLNKKVVINK